MTKIVKQISFIVLPDNNKIFERMISRIKFSKQNINTNENFQEFFNSLKKLLKNSPYQKFKISKIHQLIKNSHIIQV